MTWEPSKLKTQKDRRGCVSLCWVWWRNGQLLRSVLDQRESDPMVRIWQELGVPALFVQLLLFIPISSAPFFPI
jgi:hypothetical protein